MRLGQKLSRNAKANCVHLTPKTILFPQANSPEMTELLDRHWGDFKNEARNAYLL